MASAFNYEPGVRTPLESYSGEMPEFGGDAELWDLIREHMIDVETPEVKWNPQTLMTIPFANTPEAIQETIIPPFIPTVAPPWVAPPWVDPDTNNGTGTGTTGTGTTGNGTTGNGTTGNGTTGTGINGTGTTGTGINGTGINGTGINGTGINGTGINGTGMSVDAGLLSAQNAIDTQAALNAMEALNAQNAIDAQNAQAESDAREREIGRQRQEKSDEDAAEEQERQQALQALIALEERDRIEREERGRIEREEVARQMDEANQEALLRLQNRQQSSSIEPWQNPDLNSSLISDALARQEKEKAEADALTQWLAQQAFNKRNEEEEAAAQLGFSFDRGVEYGLKPGNKPIASFGGGSEVLLPLNYPYQGSIDVWD